MSVLNDISRHRDTRPIEPGNRVMRITPQADGSMACERESGEAFAISADDAEMQAFVVFTMLHSHEF